MSNRTPLSSRIRKDGGIKLLDINEQPIGYAQAKKRKRMMEIEEQQKKVAEAQAAAAAAASTATTTAETSTTPEYAQGLASINPPATPITPVASVQSYATPTTLSGASTVTTPQTRRFLSCKVVNIYRLYKKIIKLLLYSHNSNYTYNTKYSTTNHNTDSYYTDRKHTCRSANR